MHTHYSDGRYSPAEVIAAAQQRGLRTLAITDHDTILGSREGAPIAAAAGIELLPGIELTTCWPEAELPPADMNVDLLGYGIDLEDARFFAYTQAAQADLRARISDCCARLTDQGCPLTIADAQARNPRYAGPLQVVQAIQARGYAGSWKDALALMDAAWQSVRETPFTTRAAIEQIHLAGGAAVLAHPSIVRPRGARLEAAHLRMLVDAGLDGIEIYHYRLDEEARTHFLGLAREFGLLATGGSDMHGWARGMDDLGTQPVSEALLAALKERIARVKAGVAAA